MTTSFLQHQLRTTTVITAEDTWGVVQPGLRKIYATQPITTKQYMDMYTSIYYYCTSNNTNPVRRRESYLTSGGRDPGCELMGKVIYQQVSKFLEDYLRQVTSEGRRKFDEPLLRFYKRHWDNFTFSSQVIDNVFRYLNQHWVKREQEDNKDVYEIYSLALVTWRNVLLKSLGNNVMSAVVTLVRCERDGDSIDKFLIGCIRDSYVEMGVSTNASQRGRILTYYRDHLQKAVVDETKQYYRMESGEFLRKNPVSDYLKKAIGRLAQEEDRIKRYLHETSLRPVMQACEEALIINHLQTFYQEFQHFLDNDRNEDLGNMLVLILRTPRALQELCNILEMHIGKQGHDAIASVAEKANTEPRLYVQEIIKVYKKYKALVMAEFQNHPMFIQALDKACGAFVNANVVTKRSKTGNKSAELLARYCDFLLRKSSKVVEDVELEDTLTEIMVVFQYLESKDVFQKFYSNMLAKRLVEHLSMSDDAEASMISKLKLACGALYTSKLQKMFEDVAVNNDLNTDFRQHLKQSKTNLEVDFNVQVLTHGSWPFTPVASFALPAELETCMSRFELFYAHRHSGRKLTWLYNKSRAELVSHCFKRRYIMVSSMYQVSVLLQFNHTMSLTVQQLHDNTNIDMDNLQQVLRTLLKIRVLLCDVATSDEDSDLPPSAVIDLYQDYMNKKTRININVALKSTERKELEATHSNVDAERKYLIEAAIIRIMKTKKTFGHEELVGEVMKQLAARFKADHRSIKTSINQLIEREYLERSPESHKVYRYLA